MGVEDRANTILQKVFSNSNFAKYSLDSSVEYSEYIVIPGNDEPRWLVPSSAEFGLKVLADWSPYGASSKVKWLLLKLFYRFNILTKVPGITKVIIVKKCERNNSQIPVIPIVYVGTPGPQQKAVVTLVDVSSKKAIAILKIALGQQAKASIMHEANMLTKLAELGVENVPNLITVNEISGFALQTVLLGKLSPRGFNNAHMKFLLSLPESNEKTSFIEQKNKLLTIYTVVKVSFSSLQQKIISNAIENIKSKSGITQVLNHGDFAPWNIKQIENNDCKVIDWEDAQINGLPFGDICHFFFIQAHLFNDCKLVEQFIVEMTSNKNSIVKSYLNQMNIGIADAKQLVLLYIIFSLFNENVNPEYKAFLIERIPSILSKELNN